MARGFSLVEVVVATSLTTIATLALAHLSIVSTRVNRFARSTSVATVMALQKMEQLRALTWAFDAAGAPLSDAGLASSPAGALEQNTAGYCDFLDDGGRTMAGDLSTPPGTAFVRRWSIQPLPGGDALVVQVAVAPIGPLGPSARAAPSRSSAEVRLVGIKTRKAG